MLTENHMVELAAIPFGGRDGHLWNDLHDERELICASLLKFSGPGLEEARDLLQQQLRRVDNTLDELMSRQSIRGVNDDDAQLKLSELQPFDTILLQTANSDYRILLLDPLTGRALIEGGEYVVEPVEGLVRGSAVPGSEFKDGLLEVGARMEIWVKEQAFITSPIKLMECCAGRGAMALTSA